MTHASVFSGIGGPEVAATMLGWENLFHCEINPFGRKVLDYWYPNSKSYEDITTTDFTEWRGRVDVLTGGFPCQPFSYAGRRRGAEDGRYLWPSMYRAIDEIQPTWVVAENVAGILTMVEQGEVSKVAGSASLFDAFDDLRGRFELRETFTLQRICSDLESHGYAVQPVLVPACAVGAPHRRDRVFVVGRRNGEDTDIQRGPMGGSRASGEEHGGERSAEYTCSGRAEMPNDTSRATSNERRGSENARRPIADTESQRREWLQSEQFKTCRAAQIESGGRSGEDNSLAGCGRWDIFPTVPIVHRGNDGLPFDVDNLTVPDGEDDHFSKWRFEALKAYGNAIVPQVMYEIFRAIEQVENAGW